MASNGKFKFAIDRGGTFTDVYALCPDGKERVTKLLSVDPENYQDAPREGIRRILEQVYSISSELVKQQLIMIFLLHRLQAVQYQLINLLIL